MKSLLKLEYLALTALSFYLCLQLSIAWWWFFVLFLAPDLSMLGYLANPKIGATTYNFVHHQATAVVLYIIGGLASSAALQFGALILLGHSNFDRVWGYGLKYPDAFQHTHLGMIGKAGTN